MGFGSSASNFEFSFGFIEGWYEDEEVDVVVGDLVVNVGEGGSSSSNVAFLMDAGGEDDGGVGSSLSNIAFSMDAGNGLYGEYDGDDDVGAVDGDEECDDVDDRMVADVSSFSFAQKCSMSLSYSRCRTSTRYVTSAVSTSSCSSSRPISSSISPIASSSWNRSSSSSQNRMSSSSWTMLSISSRMPRSEVELVL